MFFNNIYLYEFTSAKILCGYKNHEEKYETIRIIPCNPEIMKLQSKRHLRSFVSFELFPNAFVSSIFIIEIIVKK